MSLRKTVLTVALVNFIWFFIQIGIAWSIGSISLMADGIDYLEDASVNLLIAIALGWSAIGRARTGKVLAFVILLPALFVAWQFFVKFSHPYEPDAWSMIAAAVAAIVVNGCCAWLLAQHRDAGGSMTKAAWLVARNDVIVNIAIVFVGVVTMLGSSGWPDIIFGLQVLILNLGASKEVWEAATEEADELITWNADED